MMSRHRIVLGDDGQQVLRWRKGEGWQPLRRRREIDFDKPCSYGAAHTRVARLYGPAREHDCVKCGERAQHWAYDGTDENELHGRCNKGYLRVYSSNPKFYKPMCMGCHNKLDTKWRADRSKEFEEFLRWKRAQLEPTG